MAALGDHAPRSGSRAFVGRDREVAELVAGLEDAIGGRERLFLITGEPGIGKTWLVEHLAAHAIRQGIRVYWGRCWEGGGAPPFWPWGLVIGALAEDYGEETLASWLGAGMARVAQLVPGFAERLGTSTIPEVVSRESDAARFYLFEAVTALFRHAASVQPVLLIFDDLHAADEPSRLLLEFLVRQLRGARLLLVGTLRDFEAARSPDTSDALGRLVREGQLVNLRGLGRDEVKDLIEVLSGAVPSQAHVSAVHEQTEGNPLFVREVVRLLDSEPAMQRTGKAAVPVPGSVRAVIWRRLAPLSSDAIQVLSAAAVVGRGFDVALVGPVCKLPVERVLGALSEAAAFGVVTDEEGAAGRYRFSHSLMREVLYERLPIPARTQLHWLAGEAIERRYGIGSETHVAELARHFAEVAVAGGEAGKALEYARRAGDRALGMYAYEEAAAEYQRALQTLSFAGPDEPNQCELLLRLGVAQSRAGNYQQAMESCLQAAEISRRLGATELLARAALVFGERQVEGGLVNRQLIALLQEALDGLSPQDSALRARLLGRLSLELTFSDEQQRTESLSRQAVAMARRLADPGALRGAIDARWMARWGPDGLDERTALAAEILRLAQEIGDRDLELGGHAYRAASSLESGDALAVEADIAAHARLAEELPAAIHKWEATTMRALRALLYGSFEDAERLANEALSLQPGRPNVMFTHLVQVALLRWEQGRLAELQDQLQWVVDQFPRAAFARAWLSLAHAEVGHNDDAHSGLRALAEQLPQRPRDGIWMPGVALASVLSVRLNESEIAAGLYSLLAPYGRHVIAFTAPQPVACYGSASLYLGLLATVTSQWAAANDYFETAMRAHERLEAGPFLARTRYEYARMLLARGQAGDRHRAFGLLDRALAIASTLGMAAVAEGIRRLQATTADGMVPAGRAAPTAAEVAAPELSRNLFRREGEYWTVAYDGSVVRLRDAKGLRLLAQLLAHPGREFHAIDLEAADRRTSPAAISGPRPGIGERGLTVRPDLGDAGVLLDAAAKAAYQTRVKELRGELEEAEAFHDPSRAAKARVELDFVVRELARAVGLGGRDRRAASHAERARLNVTRAIRAAMANLARDNPSLGRHLAATIRTGRYCSYTPDPHAPISWNR
jgi:tetratricopeptide (TPR) repeat protein